nr:flagellar basal body rod C-terminal domain-containing protein [Paludibacterium denitrificans]
MAHPREASSKSGAPLYSTPGAGLAGKLVTGSLEQSNVNMTSELVNLMAAQSNYQANSKVITAQNQMMQALMQAV